MAKTGKCPKCSGRLNTDQILALAKELPEDSQRSIIGSLSVSMRSTVGRSGGHPFSDKPRCPCQKRTLHTASLRKFECCRAAGIPQEEIDKASQTAAP